MTVHEEKLIYSMISALTLEWSDNGNIMADAVRDMCIQAVADAAEKSFDDILSEVEKRSGELQ
ncbi:MAG: hypothetical protein IPK53_17780 [bacterium]|nr:hypothetical protein [bacterium]MBK8130664.1 hypothetical protein [bacterium]